MADPRAYLERAALAAKLRRLLDTSEPMTAEDCLAASDTALGAANVFTVLGRYGWYEVTVKLMPRG